MVPSGHSCSLFLCFLLINYEARLAVRRLVCENLCFGLQLETLHNWIDFLLLNLSIEISDENERKLKNKAKSKEVCLSNILLKL
jgi:hypothetical protein